MFSVAEQLISIVEIDGMPYLAVDWLERRIYRAEVRAKRWRQEARRMERRTDKDGLAIRRSYLEHALQAEYRADKWKQCLALTCQATIDRQIATRVEFAWLINSHRVAAGMTLRELADQAGIDEKTIRHIESAAFPPNQKTLRSIIGVKELRLSWDDVSPALLEENPSDGRRNRPRKSRSRLSWRRIAKYGAELHAAT